MKSIIYLPMLLSILVLAPGCKKQTSPGAGVPKALTQAELTALAQSVPSTGPREGNNYKVFFLAIHQNQQPAVGFKVDAHVKGKSEPVTVRTNQQGLAQFDNLPFPDSRHPLIATLHYYYDSEDQPREITYPYLSSDAYRLKDLQTIPNTVTPDPKS